MRSYVQFDTFLRVKDTNIKLNIMQHVLSIKHLKAHCNRVP